MTALTLYKSQTSQLDNRWILVVAAYAGIKLEEGNEKKLAKKESKRPAFAASSGFLFTESSAIAFYLASISNAGLLLPSDLQQNAKIVNWISFAEEQLVAPLRELRQILANEVPHVKPTFDHALDKTSTALSLLDAFLVSHTFLVGERITLADLTVGTALAEGFSFVWGKMEQTKFGRVLRFEQTIINQPNLVSVFQDVKLIDKGAVYAPAKKEGKDASKPLKRKEEKQPLPVAKAADVVERVKAKINEAT